MYLLDTNVISETTKSVHNASFWRWLDARDDGSLFMSCITAGELQKGISLLPHGKRRRGFEEQLYGLLTNFDKRLIDLTAADCQLWGELMAQSQQAGTPAPGIDTFLAAQAIQRGLTLVTRNTKDFASFKNLQLFNPWT